MMRRGWRRRRGDSALALAVRRQEWERVALYLLLGVAAAARKAPPGAIDDVLDALAEMAEDKRGGATQ